MLHKKKVVILLQNMLIPIYTQVISQREDTGSVLGIHFTGPNAGEIMQGFAAAFR